MKKKQFFWIVLFIVVLIGNLGAVEPEIICKDVYYSVVKVGYDHSKISQLNYPQEDINNYYFNHYELCVLQNYTKPFPQRDYREVKINEIGLCESNEFFFDYTIPFSDINIGEISCKNFKRLNYFFNLEETESYSISDLRLWWVLGLFLIGCFIYSIRSDLFIKKSIKSQDA